MENFYQLGRREAIRALRSDWRSGLIQEEVERRRKEYGPNQLPEKKPPGPFIIFLKQINNLFSYILLGATLVTLFLGEYIDAGVIFAAFIVDIVIGFIQENKATKTITELRRAVTVRAKVVRGGRIKQLPASQLVPGDIILLDAGDKVPADARLLKSVSLETREEALTGESVPVTKKAEIKMKEKALIGERENSVFMGTVVVNGHGRGVVGATGKNTEIGQIASLVSRVKEEDTPLKARLKKLSSWIGIAAAIISVIIFAVGLIQGKSAAEMFIFAVALAIGAIPESMVVEVTIILAIGMRRILKRKAVVRELLAAETLGSTTTICADKTGTMTTGQMKARKLVTFNQKYDLDQIKNNAIQADTGLRLALTIGALNNDVHIENPKDQPWEWKILGDTTEKALVEAAISAGLNPLKLKKNLPEIDEFPFDSYIKYMVTVHRDKKTGNQVVFTKGATEKLLGLSTKYWDGKEMVELTPEVKKKLVAAGEQLSEKGYRVIGVSFKEVGADNKVDLSAGAPKGQIFIGSFAIRDPIRKSIKKTIEACQEAGIQIKMITGDHALTARAIAEDVGLKIDHEDEIMTGHEFEGLSAEELNQRIPLVKVFARVAPRDKFQIVESLQKHGEVVAMTGDGVNDGPALKRADIGVAMGTGTEVAKETSDMILLDNNFRSIVAAVEEGRLIFANLRKVVSYLLSDSLSEVLIVFVAFALRLPLPLLASQILWINLVADGLPDLALAFDPKEPGLMKEKPRKKNAPILNREMKWIIVIVGIVSAIGVLGVFYLMLKQGKSVDEARTVAFTALSIDSLLYVFSIRSLKHSFWHEKFFSNKFLLLTIIGGILLQIGVVYLPFLQTVFRTAPMTLMDWGLVMLIAAMVVLAIEILKYVFIRRHLTD